MFEKIIYVLGSNTRPAGVLGMTCPGGGGAFHSPPYLIFLKNYGGSLKAPDDTNRNYTDYSYARSILKSPEVSQVAIGFDRALQISRIDIY